MLAKTDLTTELVKEFTELQGIIGGLYATKQGIHPATADAIYDQYLPASASDSIPRSAEGWLLGLSDRIDTIRGMFSLGMEPTGSKDPFGLRRAANAIVRILAESSLPLKLSEVIKASSPLPDVEAKMTAFFAERIDFYLREGRNQAYDVVKASMAAGSEDLRDLVARAEALTQVRGSEDFIAVSAAFKRMKNILTQAKERGDIAKSGTHGGTLYPAEAILMDAAEEVRRSVNGYVAYQNYVSAFEAIATLRPYVDKYFEDVMVLDPNPIVRGTRLFLLSVIVSDILAIADLSEIVTAG
jgi:glycyl-tRNA synthetase beta chain